MVGRPEPRLPHLEVHDVVHAGARPIISRMPEAGIDRARWDSSGAGIARMLRVPILFAALTVARNTAQSAPARHRATPRRYARGHMRLAQMRVLDRRVAAVRRGESWHALASDDLGALVRSGAAALRQAADQASPEPLANPVPEAPLRPGKIVAIGLNYLDHIREAGLEAPDAPLVFAKFPSSVDRTGRGDRLRRDAHVSASTGRSSSAAVIGPPLRNVPAEEALEAVFGYTVANDVSARDLQFGDGQWTRGKSLDTFCPLGPEIVTPDEIGDPQRSPCARASTARQCRTRAPRHALRRRRAAGATAREPSRSSPATWSSPARPGGVASSWTRRVTLQPGDVVETEVEGIGVLRNPVRSAPAA